MQDFVGETIRLRGAVAGDGTPLRIRIGGGTIEASGVGPPALRFGSAVEVSMRPEDVRLQATAAAGDNGLAGHVVEVTYYGDRLECAIRIDGLDDQVVVNAERGQGLAPSNRVFLAIDRARVKLWPL